MNGILLIIIKICLIKIIILKLKNILFVSKLIYCFLNKNFLLVNLVLDFFYFNN